MPPPIFDAVLLTMTLLMMFGYEPFTSEMPPPLLVSAIARYEVFANHRRSPAPNRNATSVTQDCVARDDILDDLRFAAAADQDSTSSKATVATGCTVVADGVPPNNTGGKIEVDADSDGSLVVDDLVAFNCRRRVPGEDSPSSIKRRAKAIAHGKPGEYRASPSSEANVTTTPFRFPSMIVKSGPFSLRTVMSLPRKLMVSR